MPLCNPTSVRIPLEVEKFLRRKAKNEDRSYSAQLNWVLRCAMKADKELRRAESKLRAKK